MNYELSKLAIVIKHSDDIEQVKSLASRFLKALELKENLGPDNYSLWDIDTCNGLYKPFVLTNGTRDYCLGFMECNNSTRKVITIGTTVVWPEEHLGRTIDEVLNGAA